MRFSTGIFLSLNFCLATFGAGLHSRPESSGKGETVEPVESYCGEVEKLIEVAPEGDFVFAQAKISADRYAWRQFKSDAERLASEGDDDATNAALVWIRDGSVVAVNTATDSPSRDWLLYARYCFRQDGTLARVHSELNTFYGHVSVIRDRYFAKNGEVIGSREKFLDIHTREPKKLRPEDDFIDEPLPIYKSVRKLPFYALLKARARAR